MLFLEKLVIQSDDKQYEYFISPDTRSKATMSCFTSTFPFRFFSRIESSATEPITFDFESITLLNGDNGSGKSTVLNVLTKKLNLVRKAPFNETFYFEDFCKSFCSVCFKKRPLQSGIITSDDIFDFMIEHRTPWDPIQSMSNQGCISDKEYSNCLVPQDDAVFLDKTDLVGLKSNGQTAFQYIRDSIHPNGLYLMDEPENSLSFKYERFLFEVIREAAERRNCQFIISTHSPILLGLPKAKIYNLDSKPMRVLNWEEVPSVKIYLDFFSSNGLIDKD